MDPFCWNALLHHCSHCLHAKLQMSCHSKVGCGKNVMGVVNIADPISTAERIHDGQVSIAFGVKGLAT